MGDFSSVEVATTLPILLCHPACSGGSLIYRHLAAATGCVSVHEVGHRWLPRVEDFRPLDPESQLACLGRLSPEEFADIYWSRLLNANAIAQRSGSRLLVREHTHQYYFDNAEPIDSAISWLRQEYEQRLGVTPPTVVSYRDPVDCWLGMKASFPNLVSYTFDTYCERYLQWVTPAIEAARTSSQHVSLLKYEDFCADAVSAVRRSATALGIEAAADYQPAGIPSSGNSGRRNDATVAMRARRPYTLNLVSEAAASESYAKLCGLLGYRHLSEDSTLQPRLRSVVRAGARSMRAMAKGVRGLFKAPAKVVKRTAGLP